MGEHDKNIQLLGKLVARILEEDCPSLKSGLEEIQESLNCSGIFDFSGPHTWHQLDETKGDQLAALKKVVPQIQALADSHDRDEAFRKLITDPMQKRKLVKNVDSNLIYFIAIIQRALMILYLVALTLSQKGINSILFDIL